MDAFVFHNPDKIVFGPGQRKKLTEELAARTYSRALLVCSKGPFRENGLYDEIKGLIESAGIEVYSMGEIDSNPRITSVREGVTICKENDVHCVVALGGGSTMDCVKVIAAGALVDEDPWQYLWGHRNTFKRSLDTVMIPTIAATGTEINPFSVIMDAETTSKTYCVADCMYPELTLMDPEITLTVPLGLTVWGAMDILSHTFEYYFNGHGESIFQNRFSEAIILSVMECVDLLSLNPADLHARGELMWTSVMAWGGLTKIGRGDPDMACHTIAEGFVPFYDIHHGASLGVVTTRWMRHIVERAPNFFARFAEKIFGIDGIEEGGVTQKAKAGIEKYIEWIKKIGAPDTLQELTGQDIPDEKLKLIAKRTFEDAGGNVGIMVKLDEKDVYEILRASCAKL